MDGNLNRRRSDSCRGCRRNSMLPQKTLVMYFVLSKKQGNIKDNEEKTKNRKYAP